MQYKFCFNNFQDKEDRGEAGVTSAADLARQRLELEKQDEAMRSHAMTEQYPQVLLFGKKASY